MTAFLIDEMFPVAAAGLLRTRHGRDAVHVTEAGLRAADDTQVAAAARAKAGLSSLRTSRISPPSATWSWCSF